MKPAAILDIGSCKIVVLCGSPVNKDGITVHGVAVCPYDGYRDGEFVDEKKLHATVIEAIQLAEQRCRTRIREIAVSVPTPFVRLITSEATVPVSSRSHRVSAQEIDDLISESLKHARAAGHVLMHSTPVSFTVNGVESAEVPEGRRADEISGLVSHMYVREDFVKLIESTLSAIGVEITMCVSAQLCESLLIIPEEERVRPAVLIDVGYTHTDIAIVENAALTATASLDIGGMHFASDLSFALEIPLEAAEQVKRRYGFGQEALSNTEIIRMPTGAIRVERAVIEMIMEARANELIELMKKTLIRFGVHPESYTTTYLTGGGFCMMKGACEYLKRMLALPVKRDMPYMPEMNSPNYTSAFGALDFVLRAAGEETEQADVTVASVVDKIKELFIK